MKFFKLATALLMSLTLTTVFFSQSKTVSVKSDYVISAKAGAVNFVSGEVKLRRNDGKNTVLTKDLSIEDGELVTTAADGRAEILLNPGSYARLSENSEFELVSTSLDNLSLKLLRGSAIFEVIADNAFSILVETPKAILKLEKTGVYRFDVNEDGTALMEVWQGKVRLAGGKVVTVKAGQKTVIGNATLAVVKFDRDDKDAFELWSRDRAKELTKINSRLASKAMNQALMAYSQNSGMLSSPYGLWVSDSLSRTFCFLPLGYNFMSPYGQWYDRSLWNYQAASYLINIPANNGYWRDNPAPNNPLPNQGGGQGAIPLSPIIDSSPRQAPINVERNMDRGDRSIREVAPRVRDQ